MRRAPNLSSLWLALLAAPLFTPQAMAAPEVHLYVDGQPVAIPIALDKGTVVLTHRWPAIRPAVLCISGMVASFIAVAFVNFKFFTV